MHQPGTGAWKEGRQGGASLCYVNLPTAQLNMVQAHHARVGIRASVACTAASPDLRELVDRNWDIAIHGPTLDPQLAEALRELDEKTQRGLVTTDDSQPAEPGNAFYRVTAQPGALEAGQPLPDTLPSMPTRPDVTALMAEIDAVVAGGQWAVWRFDAATVKALGEQAHARLLRWLGDHHARIWCAPIRDIVAWMLAARP
ncbi:MAG: hypothetical protein WD534_02560 [Phycisphaeraceae bacterium]